MYEAPEADGQDEQDLRPAPRVLLLLLLRIVAPGKVRLQLLLLLTLPVLIVIEPEVEVQRTGNEQEDRLGLVGMDNFRQEEADRNTNIRENNVPRSVFFSCWRI